MKKLSYLSCFLLLAAISLWGCGEEALKGTLKISITDSPIDARDVKSVNIVFTNVEVNKGGNWISLRNFNQPMGVNLMAYSGGESFTLIDQYTDPGAFTAIRLSLNIASRNSSLVINPQSNVGLTNNSTRPIYLADGESTQLILDSNIGVSSRGITDLTLDFDLRKSIRVNEAGEYILTPKVRVVETSKTGTLKGQLSHVSPTSHIVAYAYKAGQFQTGELQEQEGIAFKNAITSTTIENDKMALGFLEAGTYDVIFVSYGESGEVLSVLGKYETIEVTADNETVIKIDIGDLSFS